jgi:two-component system sensor histidine kinase PilS (NtrC family)
VRYTPKSTDITLQVMLEPRRIIRWVYTGRLAVASSILLAAVFMWRQASADDTLIATLAFAATMAFTVGSAMYSEIYRRPQGTGFSAIQALFDLLLVTAVVHVTGGGASQFAALYILVIASAALLLPFAGGLAVAGAGYALYAADVAWIRPSELGSGVWLQIVVFGFVALGSGYISARLRQAGVGKEALAAALVRVQLEAADILRNIRSGIMTVDAHGRLLYANPAAEALLGLNLKPRVGRPVLEAIAEVAPDLSSALGRSAFQGVRTTRAEGTVERDGQTFAIGVTTTVSETEGPSGSKTATAIFSDISDSKRLESLHLRAERLEAVAELSASLAHEIKNPLASIRSAVEQLSRRPAADDDERTLATLIVRESDRLSRLLSEFLDFARARVSRVEAVDLAKVAHGAVTLASAHPDRREDVRVELTATLGQALVDGDEDLLHRALFNLVLNAVQAAPAGSFVRVDAGPARADQLPPGLAFEHGAVLVHVTDEGPGIAPELRDRLFDPFFTTKPGGSGLGLSVVHRAVEAHRGVVLVESSSRGTRFTVLLPRGIGQAELPAAAVAAPPASSGAVPGARPGLPFAFPGARARVPAAALTSVAPVAAVRTDTSPIRNQS